MKFFISFSLFLFIICSVSAGEKIKFYKADHVKIHYMGRIDFSEKLKPTMWASATQVSFSFKGSSCKLIISDEELYGKYHNYIDIIVDGKYTRLKLKSKKDTLLIATGLKYSDHSVLISKSTEAGIGYIRFEGVFCNKLIHTASFPSRKMESYGDSITSGMGSDTSQAGCHKADWYDQTNGYMSYAAITGRELNAQYSLVSASGIGLIHSCCKMDILMPQVYDKISISENKIPWNFSVYQPDVVTVCLGQNDGVQDSAAFCSAYLKFIKTLRQHYPTTSIVCLSSPMADAALLAATKKYFNGVLGALHSAGDKNIYDFYFSGQSVAGCDSHPSLQEHTQVAGELTAFIKKIKNW